MTTPLCAFPECVALARDGFDRCGAHLNVDRVAWSAYCVACQQKIPAGAWHRFDGAGRRHLGACPPKKGKR